MLLFLQESRHLVQAQHDTLDHIESFPSGIARHCCVHEQRIENQSALWDFQLRERSLEQGGGWLSGWLSLGEVGLGRMSH